MFVELSCTWFLDLGLVDQYGLIPYRSWLQRFNFSPFSVRPFLCGECSLTDIRIFLISVSLLQIPNHVAIKIALELKKLLVDNSLLDVYVICVFSLFLCD